MDRIKEIDVAKGIAIILVVVGHICARNYPEGNDWYILLKKNIYTFHMAFFFFLSGLTSYYPFEKITNIHEYKKFFLKKIKFFCPHFVFLASIIFIGKIVMQQFVTIDNEITSFTDYLIIYIDPINSYSAFLWFIYTLLLLYILTPLFLRLFRYNYLTIGVIGVAAHFMFNFFPTIFTIDRFMYFFIFYFCGLCIAPHYNKFIGLVTKNAVYLFILFCLSLILYNTYEINLCKIFSIPVLFVVAFTFSRTQILNSIGRSSYYIYLYNTICIGLSKAFLMLFIPWNGYYFYIFFLVLGFAGIAGPLLLKYETDKYFMSAKRFISF